MHDRIRAAWVFIACALLGAGAHAEIRVEPEVQPRPAIVPAPKARLADAARTTIVTLARPAPATVEKSTASSGAPGVPLKIGFGRPVAELASAAGTADRLRWSATASGGRVAAFGITSPGAFAVRAGLTFDSLPAGVLLRFYAPGAGEVVEVAAEEVRDTIARNLNAGEKGDPASIYWSPVIEGSTAVVEIELPAGAGTGSLALAAPWVSHLVTSPSTNFAMPGAKTAASCTLDVTCYSAWSNESNAVARFTFVDGFSSYVCTGTLVADTDPSTYIPFFLTANHCVSTQASASTMVSYWFYRASSCNSGVPGASQILGGGATLLYNSAATDTAFLRLNAAPPAGAVYAGWVVGAAGPAGANVAGIHHAMGDLQKISMGSVSSYATCLPTGSESFFCNGSSYGGATFFEITWNSGITQPGSSGSGVFLENGHYLIGQLYGGSTSCIVAGSNYYGRFDAAYRAGFGTFLDGTTPATGIPVTPTPTGPGAIVPALDYSALWWNPAESGWGLSITQHKAAIFAAWFVYESGGNGRWLVIPGGAWTSPTTFTGDLHSTSGPPSNQPWSSISSLRVGSATLSFSDANTGVLTYAVNDVFGSKSIQRQPFGVPDATPVASYGDLWWNAAESGWGLSINQQYRTLFAVWYTYGLYGQPVWYVMPGGVWSGDTYTGMLYRTTTAPLPFFGAPFDPHTVSSISVGSMALRFSGARDATMSYTIDGVSGSRSITRQPF